RAERHSAAVGVAQHGLERVEFDAFDVNDVDRLAALGIADGEGKTADDGAAHVDKITAKSIFPARGDLEPSGMQTNRRVDVSWLIHRCAIDRPMRVVFALAQRVKIARRLPI